VWGWVFGLLVLASALGATVHGLDLSESVRAILWQPLYLSLGLAVALFLVGGVGDWRGWTAARAFLPVAMGLAGAFFAVSKMLDGAFVLFVAYEAAALTAALAIYLFLAITRRVPGAWMVGVGIGLSLVAAAVQLSRLSVRLLVPFDHNGLFHIVQMVAIDVVARGIRRGLPNASVDSLLQPR
jgi:hypothetical protein